MWLNLYGCNTVQNKLKNCLKTQKMHFCLFLNCFWAYVGQPHYHIGWATPMPSASIYPTNPITNPWNFHEKILRIGGAQKMRFLPFYLSRPFWIFFYKGKKIYIYFASSQSKSVKIYGITRIFRNFDDYSDFQQKARGMYVIIWDTLYMKNIKGW